MESQIKIVFKNGDIEHTRDKLSYEEIVMELDKAIRSGEKLLRIGSIFADIEDIKRVIVEPSYIDGPKEYIPGEEYDHGVSYVTNLEPINVNGIDTEDIAKEVVKYLEENLNNSNIL